MPNELIEESSPYLLQHANNPVDWKAWNDKAWEKAKAQDKLVIVSIGYSACHWCHVMEHESFEDAAVAQIMNEHFICIKVDREERPDVDQVYMDAVQIITGRGGWPLNAICLPDGRPIYAGTYFPTDHWKQVLLYFHDYYQNKREEALVQAAEITRGIQVMDKLDFITDTKFPPSDRALIFKKFDAVWDYEKGGRAGAPKFPMPVNLHYLLRNYFYTKNEKALEALTVTLDNMLLGGIYDQIGGGFARYSVDAEWEIPHFEKMLYDNAQLVSVYSEAYQLTKNEAYKTVVYETLEFIEREFADKSGGFYSALDADSEGVEGKFYVWSYDKLKEILGEDFDAFASRYDVSKGGNFEGENNLVVRERRAENREQRNDNSELRTLNSQLKIWKQKLLTERAKRIRPGLDDKILTSWNALMLKGYVDAYKTFGEAKFLKIALQNAQFIKENCLQKDFRLTRNHKNGKSTINGFLDDYSFVCEAFIALYQVTFDEDWLRLSRGLAKHVIDKFYDAERGIFFYTSSYDSALISRKTETSDNVIPASNSSIAKVLFLLGTYLEEKNFLTISRQQLMNMKETTLGYPTFYANWAQLLDWFISPPYEVAIMGENAPALGAELQKYFLPNAILLGAEKSSELALLKDKFKEGETWIYVCQNKTCGLPVKTVEHVLEEIKHAI